MSLIKFWLRNLASAPLRRLPNARGSCFPTIVNYRIPRVEELEDRTLLSATILQWTPAAVPVNTNWNNPANWTPTHGNGHDPAGRRRRAVHGRL